MLRRFRRSEGLASSLASTSRSLPLIEELAPSVASDDRSTADLECVKVLSSRATASFEGERQVAARLSSSLDLRRPLLGLNVMFRTAKPFK